MATMVSSGEWYARWLPHITVGEVPPVAVAVPLSDIIDQDVPRTMVIDGFCVDKVLLARILKSYASSPGAVPYTQGMSFVAALALWVSYGSTTSADKADVAFAYHLYRRMLEILGQDFFHVLVPTAFPQRLAEVPLLGLRTCIETMRTIATSVFRSRGMFSNGQAQEESVTLEDAIWCVDLVACSWLPKGMVHVCPLTLTLEAWDRAFLFGNISALAVVTIALITLALERQQASQSSSLSIDEEADQGIGAMITCVKETTKSLDGAMQAQTLSLADAMVDEWRDIWEASRRIVHPQLISDATGKREISLIGEAWPQLRREDLQRIRLGFAGVATISPDAFADCLHSQGWSPTMAARLKNHLWPTIDDEDDDNANNYMTYAELIVGLSRWASVGLSDKLRWIFDSFVRSYGAAGGGTVPLARLMGVHEAIFCCEDVGVSSFRGRGRSVMSDPGEDDVAKETGGGLLDKRFLSSHASVAGTTLLGNERVNKFFRRLKLISCLHNDASPEGESDTTRGVSFNSWYMALISDRVLCAALQTSLMPPFCPLDIGTDVETPVESLCQQVCHRLERKCACMGQEIRKVFRRLRHFYTRRS
eukprot:GEMP01005172.1.p1 GENE.GEMP01005172.1~~GEMP01005172.1.p1  ORF type:complete len:593 (+),score=156.47 GEMP01005172.1:163-1941(+)